MTKFSSSNVQSAVRHERSGTKPGGRGQKTALFVTKQKDRSWSDDYSPFTRPTGIKGRQGTFETKRERGRRKKRQISGRIKQTWPGRLSEQKSVKRKSGSEGTGEA